MGKALPQPALGKTESTPDMPPAPVPTPPVPAIDALPETPAPLPLAPSPLPEVMLLRGAGGRSMNPLPAPESDEQPLQTAVSRPRDQHRFLMTMRFFSTIGPSHHAR